MFCSKLQHFKYRSEHWDHINIILKAIKYGCTSINVTTVPSINTEQHIAPHQAVCIRHHVTEQKAVSDTKWLKKRLSTIDTMLLDNRLY